MDIGLRHLRTLIAVADEGTFTDAAITLKVSQAAVSRTIASLEREMRVQLFHRSGGGAAPTSAGERAIRRARHVLVGFDELLRPQVEPGIRVGYAWSAVGRHTLPLQRAWAAAHPEYPIELVQSNTPSAGLLEGIADAAVVRAAISDPRFGIAHLGWETRVAVVADTDRFVQMQTLTMADFVGRVVAVDAVTGTTTEALWEDRGVRSRRITGLDEWLHLIASGHAVGLTAEATREQHARAGVLYLPVVDAPPISVDLIWWRADPPPRIEELVATIRALYTG